MSPADMRAAIEAKAKGHPLVYGALMSGRVGGLSAEDTYTLLVFSALDALERTQQALAEQLRNQPPFIVVTQAQMDKILAERAK